HSNTQSTTYNYTLSLHDALPILAIKLCVTLRHGSTRPSRRNKRDGNAAILSTPGCVKRSDRQRRGVGKLHGALTKPRPYGTLARSEEHTSELQSRENLVCRLLLE